MTQEKIKIVDYSNYDKLFEDYKKRKPDFEKFKQEAQKVLDHPEEKPRQNTFRWLRQIHKWH